MDEWMNVHMYIWWMYIWWRVKQNALSLRGGDIIILTKNLKQSQCWHRGNYNSSTYTGEIIILLIWSNEIINIWHQYCTFCICSTSKWWWFLITCFIPKFLQWTLSSLKLDIYFIANRGLSHKQNGNKSAANTAPCPATAFTSSKCHNSVKNKTCSTYYVPLHFWKASRKSLKPFSSCRKDRTWITIDNVQRAVTPKAGKSELQFLCFASCIMMIYICIKFQENILISFQVKERTQIFYRNHYFQSSKSHDSKSRLTRVTVLVFCTLFYDVLHLWEVSSKYLERFSTYTADKSTG